MKKTKKALKIQKYPLFRDLPENGKPRTSPEHVNSIVFYQRTKKIVDVHYEHILQQEIKNKKKEENVKTKKCKNEKEIFAKCSLNRKHKKNPHEPKKKKTKKKCL